MQGLRVSGYEVLKTLRIYVKLREFVGLVGLQTALAWFTRQSTAHPARPKL